MIKLSTGFRNHVLAVGSAKSALDGCVVKIYSGAEPLSADSDIGSATLLCSVSLNGTGAGISFASPAVNGVLTKNSSEIWRGSVIANGTASFFRLSMANDTEQSSTTAIRVQGTVGTILADFLVSSTNFVIGTDRQVDSFFLALPSQ